MERFPETKATGKPDVETISSWSYDMEGLAKKCVERYCELANKTKQQLDKVATPCMDDHQFKEEEFGSVGEFPTVCSQIVLQCSNLASIGRPDILWSVNKLARAVTKWTKACDKRLARLIPYIHHTCEYRQYCYVGNTAQQWRLRLLEDTDFAGDLEDSKSTSGRILCIFRKPNICTNKLDVQETDFSFTQFHRSWSNLSRCKFTHRSHSRSRSSGFSDWSISFLTKPNQQNQRCKRATEKPVVYVFEDNEAVIKNNKKSKSHNETCVKNPQSCSGLVVWQNQSWL